MTSETPSWLREAVSTFGEECRLKLSGPGDREAAIRSPLDSLLRTAGDHVGVTAVFHDEVRDTERRVRPDYGVSIAGAISGYVEVKAPGHQLDPAKFTGHDKQQWDHGLVFTTSVGTAYESHNLRRDFRRVTAAAGLGARWVPKELRTSFVSMMSYQGVPVEEIARLAGHASPGFSSGMIS